MPFTVMSEEIKRLVEEDMERERKHKEWIRSLTKKEHKAYIAKLKKKIERLDNELLLIKLNSSWEKIEL